MFSVISCGVCLHTQTRQHYSLHGNEWGVMSGSLKYTTTHARTHAPMQHDTTPPYQRGPPPPTTHFECYSFRMRCGPCWVIVSKCPRSTVAHRVVVCVCVCLSICLQMGRRRRFVCSMEHFNDLQITTRTSARICMRIVLRVHRHHNNWYNPHNFGCCVCVGLSCVLCCALRFFLWMRLHEHIVREAISVNKRFKRQPVRKAFLRGSSEKCWVEHIFIL